MTGENPTTTTACRNPMETVPSQEEKAAEAAPAENMAEVAEVNGTQVVPGTQAVAAVGPSGNEAVATDSQVESGEMPPHLICAKMGVDAAAEQVAAQPKKPEAKSWNEKRGDILRIRFGRKSY